jgi:DNA repair protein RadC
MTNNTPQPYTLTLHFNRPTFDEMIQIKGSDDVYHYLRDRIDTGVINHKEFFWIILTTSANCILGLKQISSGNATSTLVCLKEIAQLCLLANASGCVLVHNHPSGTLKPSSQDIRLTRRVAEALDLIEVRLLDHFIITQEDYFSFVENELLPST